MDGAVTHVVEIGAWEGGGSTRIIAQAAEDRIDRTFKASCFEVNRERAKRAARLHASSPNVGIIWGSIVTVDELDADSLTEEEAQWFAADRAAIEMAPNVWHLMPQSIDVLLLDGGEFSTYAEFMRLRDRLTTWLLLDDIRTRKCRKIFSELTDAESGFDLIWSSEERNGAAVFRRHSVKG